MKLDKYIDVYTNVSREEIEKMNAAYCDSIDESVFESLVRRLHVYREKEKEIGRVALRTRPLVHILSVGVQPKNKTNDPLSIYGTIYAENCDCSGPTEVHRLFQRERDVAETLGTTNNLTLIGPDFSCWPPSTVSILPSSWINAVLYDGDDNVFAEERFCLDDADFENDYEEVKCKAIPCVQGSLIVKYILIPFGVNCRIKVRFCNRQHSKSGNDFINVNGKIDIRYPNTDGTCVEECPLFEKQGIDFERVGVDRQNSLQLARCWVALPAYSPLVLTMDLSEFETSRKIVNKTIELLPQSGLMSADTFVQEEMDIFIVVDVEWFLPQPFGRSMHSAEDIEDMDTDREDMDTDTEDESSNEESDDALSSNLKLPWSLYPHKDNLWPSPAVEIFSVFIGREKSKAVEIYGSIEVLCDDDGMSYIFKRDEKDTLKLQEGVNTAPVRNGSRLFENFSSLGMKFDIKDVDGSLAIKGYVDWAADTLDSSSLWKEKQLCSFIHGQNGFAAVHYSIFSHAVCANIKVYLNFKGRVDVHPKVCGSLVTQYSFYDYSTRYNRDYYQIVLFKRSHDDSAEPSSDMTLPLSRHAVVVPSYSSLIVKVDLSFGDYTGQMLSCVGSMEIKIGERSRKIETADCSLDMELDWCEIK